MRIPKIDFSKPLCFLFCFMLAQASYAVNQPSIESDGIVLAITEATIIDGQTVTLLMPSEEATAQLFWKRGTEVLGNGLSLTITDFDQSKSGAYKLIHLLPNGTELETDFKLNYLSLGHDINACKAQTLDFKLPSGPMYSWSTGSLTNNFRITFQESAKISVEATTEFGYVVKDEKFIHIGKEEDTIKADEMGPFPYVMQAYLNRA